MNLVTTVRPDDRYIGPDIGNRRMGERNVTDWRLSMPNCTMRISEEIEEFPAVNK